MLDTLKAVLSDKSLKKNKSLFMLTVIVVLMGFLSVSIAGKTAYNYHEYLKVKEQIAQMKKEIADFEEKNAMINEQPYRPVSKDKVDYIQADVLFAIQANQLKMLDYKAAASSDGDKRGQTVAYKSFNVSFEGSYENTLKFLKNFGDKDALINLMEVSMTPKKGLINTSINYRIYLK
ncbi:MAG: hypothetical protein E7200_06395 [Selenomonas ruminantium]|nr:hypothetical protein [Selenomonas ruminantium]